MKKLNDYIIETSNELIDLQINYINESLSDEFILSEGLINKIGKWLGMKSGNVKKSIESTLHDIKNFPKTVKASYVAALQSTEKLKDDKEKKDAQSLLDAQIKAEKAKDTIDKNVEWLKNTKNTESIFYATIAKMTLELAKKENDKESKEFCEKIIKELPKETAKDAAEQIKTAEKSISSEGKDNKENQNSEGKGKGEDNKENQTSADPAKVAADADTELIKKVLSISDLGKDYYNVIQDKIKNFISDDVSESLINEDTKQNKKKVKSISESEEASQCLILSIIAYKGLEKLGHVKNGAALGSLIKDLGFEGETKKD